MRLLIGIDDTDVKDAGRGTGMLARWIGEELRPFAAVRGVTRHQLLCDPRIPYTSRNSCNVIHLDQGTLEPESFFGMVAEWITANFLEGSDPGLCIAVSDWVTDWTFGKRAQTEVVTAEEALGDSGRQGFLLRGLGGTNLGIIGAVAGVELAASGSDGRFVHIGAVRDLKGEHTAEELLAGGVEGWLDAPDPLPFGALIQTRGRVRPQLVGGKAKVRLRQIGERIWECAGENNRDEKAKDGSPKQWVFRKP